MWGITLTHWWDFCRMIWLLLGILYIRHPGRNGESVVKGMAERYNVLLHSYASNIHCKHEAAPIVKSLNKKTTCVITSNLTSLSLMKTCINWTISKVVQPEMYYRMKDDNSGSILLYTLKLIPRTLLLRWVFPVKKTSKVRNVIPAPIAAKEWQKRFETFRSDKDIGSANSSQ